MKKFLSSHGKSLGLTAAGLSLLLAFIYVATTSGPLAAVEVTLTSAELRQVTPALFGVGVVEARATHKIGATFSGRLKRIDVQVGDRVRVGQVMGEIDPVDLDDRILAQDAAQKRALSAVTAAQAQTEEVAARNNFAQAQLGRYQQLLAARAVSVEAGEAKRQEAQITQAALAASRANLAAAREEMARLSAERNGLQRQRGALRLISPIDGIVTRRDHDLGSTVVAAQSVLEIVAPENIWVNVRFDQQRALGLAANQSAQITLRSQRAVNGVEQAALPGRVVRVEPHADAVTEEILAKVEFKDRPATLPPLGELAEVTVTLAAQAAKPAVRNAAIQRHDGRIGVWLLENQDGRHLRFVPIKTGASGLDGWVQVLDGLKGGEQVVTYSRKALNAHSRVTVVQSLVPVKTVAMGEGGSL